MKKQLGLANLKKKWHQSTLNDIKRLRLPEPDHEYGFSSKLLRSHFNPAEWVRFTNWMDGQTCMLDNKLGTINYTHDVIRGIDFIRNGTPTYWD